jgi:hypothetical protein
MDNPPAYTPTTTDVARLLRARTKDATGVELGDWSAETRPTDTEVADLIDQATGPVLAELGRLEDPADPERYADLLPAARFLVTLGTACLVEKSYYPGLRPLPRRVRRPARRARGRRRRRRWWGAPWCRRRLRLHVDAERERGPGGRLRLRRGLLARA